MGRSRFCKSYKTPLHRCLAAAFLWPVRVSFLTYLVVGFSPLYPNYLDCASILLPSVGPSSVLPSTPFLHLFHLYAFSRLLRWSPAPASQTSTRLETLGEVYEHQAGLIKKLSKDIARLRNVREDNEERLDEINSVADEQRVSGCMCVCVRRASVRPSDVACRFSCV